MECGLCVRREKFLFVRPPGRSTNIRDRRRTIQEEHSSLRMTSHALEECKCVADPVRGMCTERRRRKHRIDRDDLLQ